MLREPGERRLHLGNAAFGAETVEGSSWSQLAASSTFFLEWDRREPAGMLSRRYFYRSAGR